MLLIFSLLFLEETKHEPSRHYFVFILSCLSHMSWGNIKTSLENTEIVVACTIFTQTLKFHGSLSFFQRQITSGRVSTAKIYEIQFKIWNDIWRAPWRVLSMVNNESTYSCMKYLETTKLFEVFVQIRNSSWGFIFNGKISSNLHQTLFLMVTHWDLLLERNIRRSDIISRKYLAQLRTVIYNAVGLNFSFHLSLLWGWKWQREEIFCSVRKRFIIIHILLKDKKQIIAGCSTRQFSRTLR